MTYDIERENAIRKWIAHGFPAIIPITLFSFYKEAGVEDLTACHRVCGDLGSALDPACGDFESALDPRMDSVTARATGVSEAAIQQHERLRDLRDVLLRYLTLQELGAIRRAEHDRRRDPPEIMPPG